MYELQIVSLGVRLPTGRGVCSPGPPWDIRSKPFTGQPQAPASSRALAGGPRGARPQAHLRPTLSAAAWLAPLVSRGGERRPTGSRAAGRKGFPSQQVVPTA